MPGEGVDTGSQLIDLRNIFYISNMLSLQYSQRYYEGLNEKTFNFRKIENRIDFSPGSGPKQLGEDHAEIPQDAWVELREEDYFLSYSFSSLSILEYKSDNNFFFVLAEMQFPVTIGANRQRIGYSIRTIVC